MDHARGNDLNVIFDAGQPALGKKHVPGSMTGLFIGPEGGWQEEELAEAHARRFRVSGLGPMTLRAETAAMVAVYSMVN